MAKLLRVFANAYFWLAIIVVLGLVVRLYKINNPIADWHSWRQADTAAVTRNFVKDGFNPFYPKYDDYSGVAEDPIPNLGRFRFVEFPFYNIAVYPFYKIFGVKDIYSRLVSVFFSLGSIIFLYFITKRYTSKFTGLVAAFVYALLPYNIYFSRVTLPEPLFVCSSLGFLYFSDLWINERKFFWWAVLYGIVALLIKPWVLFLGLPLIYLIYKKGKILQKKYFYFVILIFLPFIFWRLWILQHPEGIPASNWLFDGDHLRFHPSFWWWLVSQRLGNEILGVTGFFFFFLGLILKPKNGNYFLHIWALGMFLYLSVVATGNVRHDYYQYIIVPILAIFVSIGFTTLITGFSNLMPRFWTIPLGILFLGLMFYFGWVPIKELYKVNNPPIVSGGKIADQILPKDAIVVAPYNGDTAFLYQTNRPGWAIVAEPLPQMVADFGVTSYVSVNRDDQTNWVRRHFQVLVDQDNLVIADLTKPTGNLYDPKDKEP